MRVNSTNAYTAQSWACLIGFASLIVYFNLADVYHQYFFSAGITPVIYNFTRILFIFSMMWLLYFVGDYVLTRIALDLSRDSYTLSSFLQGFFTGAGIWQAALFLAGFAALYLRSVMISASLIIFICSLPRLNGWLQQRLTKRTSIYWPGCLLLTISTILFLITKGLYPAGGHDYFNHYFPYYRMVTESGTLLPNAVWYHFYYSKGAGLFFFSMLVTDPLAPQLASTAMIFAGAGIVFQVLRGRSEWRLLPWIGASLFLLCLIYTPGAVRYWQQGGWGDLEKIHEPASMLMLAMLWLVVGLFKASDKRTWGVALVSSMTAMALINAPMALFGVVYLGLLTVYCFASRMRQISIWIAASVIVGGICIAAQWVINYYLTGLPDDKQLFLYWPIINFSKINNWGVSFELVQFNLLKTTMQGHQLSVMRVITRLASYLRLDIWGALFFLPLLLSLYKPKFGDRIASAIFGSFLLCIAILSIFVGRDQPVSFYRFTTFTYAPMLCFCLLLCAGDLNYYYRRVVFILSCLLGLFILLTVGNKEHDKLQDLRHVLTNGQRFMFGEYSIADAYRHQEGWPGRLPWGGIYPAAESAWKLLPPNTRIWRFNAHSYCMLPDCRMEGYMSYRFSPHAEQVYFGDPETAKYWLKKENLNYFFISTGLPIDDPLPRSPLFAPATIANHLGIVWTDGESALLTWKEQSATPIDSAWLQHYNQRVKESGAVQSFPFNDLQVVFKTLHANGTLKQSDLPWSSHLKG